MGYYVNPPNQSKESWLKANCEPFSSKPDSWNEGIKRGLLPVVLIDNTIFTAAGIGFSPEEFDEFTNPDDTRPKSIYWVQISKLLEVSDLHEDIVDLLLHKVSDN